MLNKTASFLFAMALGAASSAHAATTIVATGFNLTYLEGTSIGAFDMTLLSDANGTVRIGLDLGLSPYTQNTDGGNGDFAVHQLLGAVRDGYRITSYTLTADVTGSLYVEQHEPCGRCVVVWEGMAQNGASARATVTNQDGLSSTIADNAANLNGGGQLMASGALQLAGAFGLELGATDYVEALGAYHIYDGEVLVDYHYGASSSIDLRNMVLTVQVSPVPEPGTYAMLLAGLGVAGWAARRRRT